jgi:C1A family cysteine protease
MSKHCFLPADYFTKRSNARKNKVARKNVTSFSGITLPKWGTVKAYNGGLIYDQSTLGSCTANAFCAACNILQNIKYGKISFWPSRLFLYFHERLLEDPNHNVSDLTDSGADVVDGASYVKTFGICSETSWPYDITKYNDTPPSNCDQEALGNKIGSYHTLPIDDNLLTNIKQAITNKTPVLIAVSVYDSFESESVAVSGLVPIPQSSENLLGGHELCLVGYNDTTQLFTVQNSWGSGWGKGGYAYFPYKYIADSNLCSECTVIQL